MQINKKHNCKFASLNKKRTAASANEQQKQKLQAKLHKNAKLNVKSFAIKEMK